jgi:hypothetical protein
MPEEVKEEKEKNDYSNWLKVRMAAYQVRTNMVALLCVTAIALLSLFKLSDPENIIINIIIAISSFKAGQVEQRSSDEKPTMVK